MKIQSKLTKMFVIPSLLTAAIILSMAFPVRAQKASPQIQDNGFIYSTGLIGIKPGQIIRLAAANEGNLTIPFQFRIVDDKGLPLFLCNEIALPGNAVYRDFEYTGDAIRIEVNGQVRVGSNKELQELAPSVQVIDAASGKNVSVLSSGKFRSFSSVYNPPTPMLGQNQESNPTFQKNEKPELIGLLIGYSPGLVGLTSGQILRMSVVNEGNLTIPLEFRIFSDKGLPLFQCNEIVLPGQSAFVEFQYLGDGNRVELNTQIRVGSDKALKELSPSLQVIETVQGNTFSVFGGGDFTGFTKMFVPTN